jgi:UDP-N-acetylmuramoyl-tripeptide--D-alanyl-D-alanine ligase
MEVIERRDGVTLVNDAYNANPDSMHAALGALARMGQGRRTWAVLGTMLELGPESDSLHAEVGADVVAHGIGELLVVGAAAASLAAGARAATSGTSGAGGANLPDATTTRVREVPHAEAAQRLLRAELAPGDVVLFKSSRDAGLRLLGDRMAQDEEELT